MFLSIKLKPKNLFPDFFSASFYITGLIINFILWIIILTQKVWQKPSPLPLHYNIYLGIDLSGPYYHIFIFPFLALVLLIFNWRIGSYIYLKAKILSHFLGITALALQIISFLWLYFLISETF